MAIKGEADPRRHEFRVVIAGLELDRESKERISQAVQAAALQAIGSLDFKGDLAARIGGNGTQGIELVALTPRQSEIVGFGEG